MRVPLSWIRDFTPADQAPVEELVAALNQLGLEVEGVENPGGEIAGVVAAKVLDVVAHPNADKLTLVDVDHGDGQTRVVCGAPNVKAGMVVPYAASGSTIAGGVQLSRRKIRGVESDGMLCAPDELGLGDDHAGILELDASTELGRDVREVLGLDDVVLDLSITPNRPDAMCVVGVARELAAHFGWPLDVPEPHAPRDAGAGHEISVGIEVPDRCPRYLGWVAQVQMGESPTWMQQRLIKAGMRPISNVVDVTNYVLLERNQPLHAFDLARLAGPGIVVRLAGDDELMTTLDGVERTLASEDLLICDAERMPQAIAGIMGGGDSEVTDTTTEILLESAYFERMGIARSSKRLKLRSEASARFERGIDPNDVASSAERAMELLSEVAGARVAPEVVDEYPRPLERIEIRLRTSKVNRVLGSELGDTQVVDALRPLGIEIEGAGDDLVARPPTFRPDLEREIDLVEEVARRVGFDAIGRTVARPAEQVGGLTHHQRDRRLVVDTLVGAGLLEAVTIPLVAPGDLDASGAPVDRVVEAANPLRAEESVLRTSLLPGLLRAAARNRAHLLEDVALFELGRVFLAPTSNDTVLPDEPWHVAAVLAGAVHRRPVEPDREVDAHDAADIVRELTDALELADVRLEPASPAGFHPSRTTQVVVDGDDVGSVGELGREVVDAFGLVAPVVGLELDLDALIRARRRDRAFRPLSPYPLSTVDLAFVIDDAVPAAAIDATLRQTVGDLLEDVHCFDEFRSDALGPGRKSLAFALRFRAPDRTLTDEDIAQLRQRAIDAVTKTFSATLRG